MTDLTCPRHPGFPAGRCPECVAEAADGPPPQIEAVKAALRRSVLRRAEEDERVRRAEAVTMAVALLRRARATCGEGTLIV